MKLDLGCGTNKKPGYLGVDCRKFDGVDHVMNIGQDPWPWTDGSVEDVWTSHFIEHLKPNERIHFANELWRVLQPKGTCTIVVPAWSSCRAYGDLTHQWPPVSEFWPLYLNKEWRKVNAPHNDGYNCNFGVGWGYSPHPELQQRNADYQQDMLKWSKEAALDMVATFTKAEMK